MGGRVGNIEDYTERELILEKQMGLLPEGELVRYIGSYYKGRSLGERFSERIFGTKRPLDIRVAEKTLSIKRTKYTYDFDMSFG